MRFFDEMHVSSAQVRDHYQVYDRWLARQPRELMRSRREEAEMIFRRVGITFAVYGEKDENGAGNEPLTPLDLIPRSIRAPEWRRVGPGLRWFGGALGGPAGDAPGQANGQYHLPCG